MLQKYKVEYTEKNLKYFYNGTSPQKLNSKYTLEKKENRYGASRIKSY